MKLPAWLRDDRPYTREPFRVGFDLDGVLADMTGAMAGPPGEQRSRGSENFWEGLVECEPEGVARLAALAEARHWEVVFVTRRPPTRGRTSQQQTQRWLQRHGFALPSVCVVSESRGQIARALSLDAIVDDLWDACIDVLEESSAIPILLWRGPCPVAAEARRLGITVASTLDECFAALCAHETSGRRGHS